MKRRHNEDNHGSRSEASEPKRFLMSGTELHEPYAMSWSANNEQNESIAWQAEPLTASHFPGSPSTLEDYLEVYPLRASDDTPDQLGDASITKELVSNHSNALVETLGTSGSDSQFQSATYEYVCYGTLDEIRCQSLESAKGCDFAQLPRSSIDDNYVELSLVSGQ